MAAIKKACVAGKGQMKERRDVVRNVKKVVDPELDPRWHVPLLDEVERSAERQVLHLPDPVERLVQARRLTRTSSQGRPGLTVGPSLRSSPGRLANRVDTFIQLTLNGLTLGSVYALIALGYSLVYGILKLLNFAHGDVFMVGTFIGFGALQLLGGSANPIVPVWLLLILITLAAMAGCAVLGVAIERFAYRPLRDAPQDRAVDQRPRRLVLHCLLDAAAVRRRAQELRHVLDGRRRALLQGLRHRQRAHPADPDHHHRRRLRDDDPALAARHADAARQGDARHLPRPRGRRDDGHRHRQGDRLRLRARLGARRRRRACCSRFASRPTPRSGS